MSRTFASLLAGGIGGAIVGGVAYYFIRVNAKKAVQEELAASHPTLDAELRRAANENVRPAVDTQIRLTLAEYGVTPQLMLSVTRAANRLGVGT